MKVALTGATGFLGRYVTAMLQDQGHQVIAWCRDRDRTPQWPSVQWVVGRLGDAAAARSLIADADAVVHAGLYRPGDSFVGDEGDPVEYFQRNVIGSLQLLEAAADRQLQRFVFVSSGTVHDRVVPADRLSDHRLDELHPLWPSSVYGAYKASVETLIHSYGFSGKLNCCTLRPTAIYGVADPIEDSKWYPLIRDLLAGRTVNVSGGSKEVHAGDVAKAIGLLLTTETNIAGETFNCSDRLISRYEVAHTAARLANCKADIRGEPKEGKHQMDTSKLKSLGMRFGGTELLESTLRELITHCRTTQSAS